MYREIKLTERGKTQLVFCSVPQQLPSTNDGANFFSIDGFFISIGVWVGLSTLGALLGRVELIILGFCIFILFNVLALAWIITDSLPQPRRQSEPVTTCTVNSKGVTLVTPHPINQTKVYKPEEVKFSFESMGFQPPSMKIKLRLGMGSETEELNIHYVDSSLANEIARILNLPIPFPPCKQYDIYDDDAWKVSYLSFYPDTQTVKITVGHQSGWNVSRDFERTVRLQDIADVKGEIIDGTRLEYRYILVLQSGEHITLMEDSHSSHPIIVEGKYVDPTPEQTKANLEKIVKAEVDKMRNFLGL